jgi:Mn-dependent DtxR family transcriptional regulator
MTSNPNAKLSKLQKFILVEAFKTLPEVDEIVRKHNAWMRGGVSIGVVKSELKPIEACNVGHIARNEILTQFFKLKLRKYRFQGWVTDTDTNRIDAEAVGRLAYNRANASLYRAIRRLEARGLIKRMTKKRGLLQLTEAGIAVAEKLRH